MKTCPSGNTLWLFLIRRHSCFGGRNSMFLSNNKTLCKYRASSAGWRPTLPNNQPSFHATSSITLKKILDRPSFMCLNCKIPLSLPIQKEMCFRVRRDCRHQTIRTPRHFKRKYITCLFSSCQRRCSRQRRKRGQFCTSSLTSRYSSFCVPTFLFSLAEALVLQLPEY